MLIYCHSRTRDMPVDGPRMILCASHRVKPNCVYKNGYTYRREKRESRSRRGTNRRHLDSVCVNLGGQGFFWAFDGLLEWAGSGKEMP
jgi:hypothetical protein